MDEATERGGIFAGSDPFAISREWLNAAESSEANDPGAMALATVDPDGLPNARMVLLKEIEADAFVFYTNYESVKARELDAVWQGGACDPLEVPAPADPRARISGEGGRRSGRRLLPLPLIAVAAGSVGLATEPTAEEPGAPDGRGRQGHCLEGDRPRTAAVLGRLPDHPDRDRVLGRRRPSASRPLPLEPRRAGRSLVGVPPQPLNARMRRYSVEHRSVSREATPADNRRVHSKVQRQ